MHHFLAFPAKVPALAPSLEERSRSLTCTGKGMMSSPQRKGHQLLSSRPPECSSSPCGWHWAAAEEGEDVPGFLLLPEGRWASCWTFRKRQRVSEEMETGPGLRPRCQGSPRPRLSPLPATSQRKGKGLCKVKGKQRLRQAWSPGVRPGFRCRTWPLMCMCPRGEKQQQLAGRSTQRTKDAELPANRTGCRSPGKGGCQGGRRWSASPCPAQPLSLKRQRGTDLKTPRPGPTPPAPASEPEAPPPGTSRETPRTCLPGRTPPWGDGPHVHLGDNDTVSFARSLLTHTGCPAHGGSVQGQTRR